MNFLRSIMRWSGLLAVLLLLSLAMTAAQAQAQGAVAATKPKQSASASNSSSPALIESGGLLFRRNCSFCHGRDATGGESGPDLTRSKLVAMDVGGDKIGVVVRNGRPDKGMRAFDFSDQQIAGLVAFIHNQRNMAVTKKGGRKGVDVADLQTGNVNAGKQYFEGAGGCATCHSPTGDLAGVATRYKGLELEEQMLYPRNAKSKVTVTLTSGETVTGTLRYIDEFTVGLVDATGTYRSWRTSDVQYKIDSPVEAHVAQFSKYTDDDIHNLMAYLQTLH